MTQKRQNIPWITVCLIIINFIIFGLWTVEGGNVNNEVSLRFGAQYLPLVVKGEYWRIFTSMFVHFGWEHLSGNMLSLFFMGQIAEAYFGRVRFLLLYLISGIGGNVLSLYMDTVTNEVKISAGASGAIFGVMAVFFIFAFDAQLRKAFPLPRVLLGVVLALAPGFYSENIDLYAHIGGFVVGLLVAYLLKFTLPKGRYEYVEEERSE
ncbi:MAG: rhomboid family intramembrane serine protease [Lachnospiraceae bacterium]|nr:rhomboid family intramembrane serine protease [Lachnospiraceae bacterium]